MATQKIRTNLNVTGTLNVSGATTVAGITAASLSVSGAATVGTTLSVTGATSLPGGITGGLSIAGNVTMANNLNVTGSFSVSGGVSYSGPANFMDNAFSIEDNVDATKKLDFQMSGAATGTTTTISPAQTANRVITLPDATTVLVGDDVTQALTNKTINADLNTITNIEDADIKVGAAINRAKIAAGTANHVVINDGSGNLSSSLVLDSALGGTGADLSGQSGIVKMAVGVGLVATSLSDSDIDAAAAIARSKLASGTASHVVINDGSGVMSSEASLDETRGGTGQTSLATGDTLYASASNTMSKLGIGSAGQQLKVSNAGVPAWEDRNDASKETSLFDDFLGGTAGDTLNWQSWSGGGTAATSNVSTNIASNHPGILRYSTGTTAGVGRAGHGLAVSANPVANGVVLGTNSLSLEYVLFLGQLSTVGDEFFVSVGLHAQSVSTTQTNSVIFRYDRLNYGANWQCETSSASVVTRTDSGVAAAASTWVRLTIVATSTSVTFYIDGVLVATHNTNIPSTVIAPGHRIEKTAGTTSTYMDLDYFKLYSRFSTAR